MEIEQLEPELSDHLRAEFGDKGRQAVEFLRTAHELLSSDLEVPRKHEAVAYCLREALVRILAKFEPQDGKKWRDVSREVVKARKRYGLVVGMPGEDQQGALDALLRSIDELERFHDQPGRHRRRLREASASVDRADCRSNRC